MSVTITCKKSGPSKNNPQKYGWILDENEKFWNVLRAHADAAAPGSRWDITFHVNAKGYEEVDTIRPSGEQPSGPVGGSNPEKGMIMKEAILMLLVHGKSDAEAVELFLRADAIYNSFIEVRDGQGS